MVETPTRIWLPPMLVLLIAVLCVPVGILEEEGVQRYERLREEVTDVEKQNSQLREEIRELKNRVEELRSHPKAIERVAREKHGLSSVNETVIRF